MRAIGGMLFLTGMLLMVFNAYMTIRQSSRQGSKLEVNPAKAAA
jgi:cbb3-type cytochrome oxidase subunit 1